MGFDLLYVYWPDFWFKDCKEIGWCKKLKNVSPLEKQYLFSPWPLSNCIDGLHTAALLSSMYCWNLLVPRLDSSFLPMGCCLTQTLSVWQEKSTDDLNIVAEVFDRLVCSIVASPQPSEVSFEKHSAMNEPINRFILYTFGWESMDWTVVRPRIDSMLLRLQVFVDSRKAVKEHLQVQNI